MEMLKISEIIKEIDQRFREKYKFLEKYEDDGVIFKDEISIEDYENNVHEMANDIVNVHMGLREYPIDIKLLPEYERDQIERLNKLIQKYPVNCVVRYFVTEGLLFYKDMEFPLFGYTKEQFEETKNCLEEQDRNKFELRLTFMDPKNEYKVYEEMREVIYQKFNYYGKQVNIENLGLEMKNELKDISIEVVSKKVKENK